MARHRPRCRFCSIPLTKKNETKEHVIPDWLQTHFDLKGTWLSHGRVKFSTGEFLAPPRSQVLGSLLLGKVCKDCNEGWMSELEKAVIPFLIPLIEGTLDPDSLLYGDSELLSRWLLKTMYAFQEATGLRKAMPLTHAILARDWKGSMPLGGSSFIARVAPRKDGEPIFFNQSKWTCIVEEAEHLDAEEVKRGYKAGILLGPVGFMLSYWPPYSEFEPYFLASHVSPLVRDARYIPLVTGKVNQVCTTLEGIADCIRLTRGGYMDDEFGIAKTLIVS